MTLFYICIKMQCCYASPNLEYNKVIFIEKTQSTLKYDQHLLCNNVQCAVHTTLCSLEQYSEALEPKEDKPWLL